MDRDSNTSEQPTPPPSAFRVYWDRVSQFIPAGIFFLAFYAAINSFVSYQTDIKSEIVKVQAEITAVKSEITAVKSEIARVEQKVDSLEEKIDIRFDAMMQQLRAMQQVFSTKVDYLEKKTDANAKAIEIIQQTLNEASQ